MEEKLQLLIVTDKKETLATCYYLNLSTLIDFKRLQLVQCMLWIKRE